MLTNENIARIERLIREYTILTVDAPVIPKLWEKLEEIKATNVIKFSDTAFLAGTLKVSPDYITGLTNDPEPKNAPADRILAATVRLQKDLLDVLAAKADELVEAQETVIDFEAAGILVRNSAIYKPKPSKKLADRSRKYNN